MHFAGPHRQVDSSEYLLAVYYGVQILNLQHIKYLLSGSPHSVSPERECPIR